MAAIINPPSALAGDKVVLQLKWKHQFQFAGYYAAIEKGYYKQAGIEVELQEGTPSTNTVKEVTSGRAQYGVTNSEALLHRIRGAPLVMLAAIFQHSPLVFVCHRKTGITSPQEMAGRRIKMSRGSRDVALHACLRSEGVSLDLIELVDGRVKKKDYFDPKLDVVSAYLSNEIYYFIEKGMPYITISPLNYGIDFYGDCLITSERELALHPGRVKAFREASLRGWQYAMEHTAEMIKLIKKNYRSDKTAEHLAFEAQAMQGLIMPRLVEIGHMNPGRWKHIAEVFADFGWVEKGYTLDGFLYDPDPAIMSARVRWTVAITLLLAFLAALISLALYRFNRRLKLEVAERKQAQEALAESEERFVQFMKHLPALAFIKDHDGRYLYVNQAYRHLLGVEPEERLGRTDDELWPEDTAALFRENDRRILEKGETIRVTEKVTDANGREQYHLTYKFPLIKEGGQSMVAGIAFDITGIMETEDALRQSEEKYRSVMEATADPMVVYDMEGKATYINPAFTRVFGWESWEILQGGINFVPEEEGPVTARLMKKLRKGEDFSGILTRRYTKEGNLRDVSLSGANHHNDRGDPAGSIIILRDVTEQRITEAQLRQAQKMEAIGTLAGGIAHDFNNILAAITGFAELGLDNLELGQGDHDELKQILRAADRAASLVSQILTFSRKAEMEHKPLDLNRIVKHSTNLLAQTLPKMVNIDLNLEEKLWGAIGDSTQLEQVLLNLGSNANDAMPGGGNLHFETKNLVLQNGRCAACGAEFSGEYAVLRVTDNGEGMPPEVIKHIFDPFFTTKEVGKGTGLGMSTVFGVIKSHGGHITCDSKPGKGTTFNLHLPALRAEELPTPPNSTRPESLPGGVETILVVDDEKALCDIAGEILSRSGYSTLTAGSGEEALQIYQSKGEGIDLVILDLSMPGMGGQRCLEGLLEIDPKVRVVIASGFSRDGRIDATLFSGAIDYISKPFKRSTLLLTVRQALDA